MAQHNITTLYIQDPNGGQPQMIKVVGAKPNLGSTNFVTLNSSSGSSSSSNTGQQQKTIYRTVTTTQADQGGSVSGLAPGTIIHAGKLTNGQIVTLPRVAGTAGNVIRPVVVPVSNLQQFKSSLGSPQQAALSRPVLIRTQTGNMVTTANAGQATKLSNARPGVLHTSVQQIQQQRLKTQLQQQKQLLQQQQEQQSVQMESQRQHSLLQQQQQQPKPQQIVIQKPQQFKLQQLSNSRQIVQLQQQQQTTQQQQQQLQNSPPKTLLTPILDHTAARKRHDFDFDYSIDNKRRKTEKGGKGLRHFSMKVCEKVKAKGRTSYNEVADELVAEFCDPTRCAAQGDANDDQKNIRRRVYDALNVLMAMDIISKEKKEIRWLGLPTNTAQECHKLLHERSRRQDRIRLKTQQLHDLILQHIAFKRLVERNRLRESERGAPPPPNTAIHLPFVVVATANSTTIDCSIANDKTEYLFNFDGTFEVHDDIEVLKRMGLALGLEKGECSEEDVTRAKEMLPNALESYVDDLSRGPPPPHILSRDELVQQLGGVSIAGGEFGAQAGGGGGLLVMETSDSIGGALGGVQRLSTEGGVLEGRVARSIALDSPDYSAAGDDDIEDSDTELG